jgi:hypothetical protein
MKPASDTSPEARRVLTEAYRAMPPARKLRLIGQEFLLARRLHETGLRRERPHASRSEVSESWNAMILGPELWKTIRRDIPMGQDIEPLAVLVEVVAAFEALGIAYAVGGSWASSLYGEARMTRDADVAVEPFPGKEQRLAASFSSDYYLSLNALGQAVRERSSFYIIHIPTGFKVDVFVLEDEGFERSLMARRSAGPVGDASGQELVWVSAEDIVLLKLRRDRLGNEAPERQWSDVLGVLRTRSGRLDTAYLDHWAGELGVLDLWDRARDDAARLG